MSLKKKLKSTRGSAARAVHKARVKVATKRANKATSAAKKQSKLAAKTPGYWFTTGKANQMNAKAKKAQKKVSDLKKKGPSYIPSRKKKK